MSEEYEDNEQANGGKGRFEGLDTVYSSGGSPRAMPSKVNDAIAALGHFLRGTDLEGGKDHKFGSTIPTVEFCREFKALRDAKDVADAVAKEINRRYDFMRLSVLVNRMDEEQIRTLKIDGVGRVQIQGDVYVSVLAADRENVYQWFKDEGKGDVVKETVNHNTLKAIMKKRLEDGEEIPEGVKCEPFSYVKLVAAK